MPYRQGLLRWARPSRGFVKFFICSGYMSNEAKLFATTNFSKEIYMKKFVNRAITTSGFLLRRIAIFYRSFFKKFNKKKCILNFQLFIKLKNKKFWTSLGNLVLTHKHVRKHIKALSLQDPIPLAKECLPDRSICSTIGIAHRRGCLQSKILLSCKSLRQAKQSKNKADLVFSIAFWISIRASRGVDWTLPFLYIFISCTNSVCNVQISVLSKQDILKKGSKRIWNHNNTNSSSLDSHKKGSIWLAVLSEHFCFRFFFAEFYYFPRFFLTRSIHTKNLEWKQKQAKRATGLGSKKIGFLRIRQNLIDNWNQFIKIKKSALRALQIKRSQVYSKIVNVLVGSQAGVRLLSHCVWNRDTKAKALPCKEPLRWPCMPCMPCMPAKAAHALCPKGMARVASLSVAKGGLAKQPLPVRHGLLSLACMVCFAGKAIEPSLFFASLQRKALDRWCFILHHLHHKDLFIIVLQTQQSKKVGQQMPFASAELRGSSLSILVLTHKHVRKHIEGPNSSMCLRTCLCVSTRMILENSAQLAGHDLGQGPAITGQRLRTFFARQYKRPANSAFELINVPGTYKSVKSIFSLTYLIIKKNTKLVYPAKFYWYRRCFFAMIKKINFFIHSLLWLWIKKRHNKKSNSWLFKKYWIFIENKPYFYYYEKRKIYYLIAYS